MKKLISFSFFILLSLITKSQSVGFFSNTGIVSRSFEQEQIISSIGIELLDKVGFEYGFSISNLGQDKFDKEKTSITKYYSTHVYLEHIGRVSTMVGAGFANTKITNNVYPIQFKNEFNPFAKFGITYSVNSVVGLNAQLIVGTLFGAQTGIKLTFR